MNLALNFCSLCSGHALKDPEVTLADSREHAQTGQQVKHSPSASFLLRAHVSRSHSFQIKLISATLNVAVFLYVLAALLSLSSTSLSIVLLRENRKAQCAAARTLVSVPPPLAEHAN